ncbi:MAG: TetR/AcrR family transcriptional regulator [Acidobacteriota bacterium]
MEKTTPPSKSASADAKSRRREILETAARLICEKGYKGTSLRDIAEACGLTKAGLYHHSRSKDHLLFEIMSYGMDLFEEQVLYQVMPIADPVARLRACMHLNVLLVTEDRTKEVTIILHEHATLTGEAQAQINARKKRYVRFLETSFAEAIRDGAIQPVNPKVAAFSFLGQVLWIYKWFRADGSIAAEDLAAEMEKVFFDGMVLDPSKPEGTREKKESTQREALPPGEEKVH